MATYNANISVKVAGLTQLKNLENRVSQLQDRFTKLNAAAARVTAPFQGHIKALTEINKLLKDNNALLNQQARVASSVSRGSGSSSGAVKDARVQKEITEQLQRQVTLLRDRARATAPAGDAMQKLLRAQLELNNGAEGNIRLVRQLIRNARELVKADEDRLKVSREVKTATEQRVDEAKELLAVERQIGQMLNETKRKTAEIAREDAKRAKARKEMIGGAVGRVDRAFGGGISGALNGVANAGIRAGAVGGLLAGSQLMGAAQSMPVIGKAVSALQGPLIEAIRLLGDFAGHWGLAAVAAAAFAPLLPKIGQAAIQAMPGIGSLGKAIADVTGLSERAQPAINGLKKSWDTLVSSNPATSLFGLGANSMQLTGGQAPELMNGAAKFQSTMGLDMVEKIAQGIYQQIQASADAMEANRQKAKSWADALEEGRNWIKESVAKTRELEQAMSEAARQRLAASAANNPRVRAGAAMVNTGFREYGPGGNSMTAQSQYRGMLNAQAKLDNETRYSWVQFLRQGQALQRELVVLSKQEAAEAAKATDEAREALMIKQREIDFENRLGRVREKNAAIAARDNATKQRNYGIRTGIGAGLSLANIPGQAIAQSISIGAAVGGAPGGIAGGITASVVALGQLAVKSAEVGAQSEMLQNRLKLLSNGLDDYAKVAQTATTIGDKFGLSQNEAAEAFANTYARLRPMGATLEEVKTVFEGFNTAMRLAG
ncbi:MAG: hypothetical protein ACO23G_10835, partial [Limnohabitans sp.]